MHDHCIRRDQAIAFQKTVSNCHIEYPQNNAKDVVVGSGQMDGQKRGDFGTSTFSKLFSKGIPFDELV